MIERMGSVYEDKQDKIYFLLLSELSLVDEKLKQVNQTVSDFLFGHKNLLEGDRIWCMERLTTIQNIVTSMTHQLKLFLPTVFNIMDEEKGGAK